MFRAYNFRPNIANWFTRSHVWKGENHQLEIAKTKWTDCIARECFAIEKTCLSDTLNPLAYVYA